MQNNVSELTQKLLRSVDSNYNVINMPEVLEVISVLERMQITKELLEATRLGKHINELRRKATTESLQKRSKELVKRWRRLLFPNSNGQLTQTSPVSGRGPTEDVNLNQLQSRKRPASDKSDSNSQKRFRMNGTSELDFSDNSNSSFKDVLNSSKAESERVILINSDSNSSFHDARQDPVLEQQQPKKRGRKKGSKNHRNLLDEAETSFSNKMAVSRGNAKVKTTQELVASLQNRSSTNMAVPAASSSNSRPAMDDLMERAAKLTERVSIIDQKLNTNANRKNSQKKLQRSSLVVEGGSSRNDKIIESGIVVNVANTLEDEIIVVDDFDQDVKPDPLDLDGLKEDPDKSEAPDPDLLPKSYSIEEAIALLPPIDYSNLEDSEDEPRCTCVLKETKNEGFSLDDPDSNEDTDRIEFIEDCNCEAKRYLEEKYHKSEITEERAKMLNDYLLPGINSNASAGTDRKDAEISEDGLYLNVVPNVYIDLLPKRLAESASDFEGENYKRYSISDCKRTKGMCENDEEVNASASDVASDIKDASSTFREFHETVETPSYNGETFRILPYVIID